MTKDHSKFENQVGQLVTSLTSRWQEKWQKEKYDMCSGIDREFKKMWSAIKEGAPSPAMPVSIPDPLGKVGPAFVMVDSPTATPSSPAPPLVLQTPRWQDRGSKLSCCKKCCKMGSNPVALPQHFLKNLQRQGCQTNPWWSPPRVSKPPLGKCLQQHQVWLVLLLKTHHKTPPLKDGQPHKSVQT